MTEISMRRWSRLAIVGALAATLALSACGRKGPLDPPPAAAMPPQQTVDAGPAAPTVVPAVPGAAPLESQGFPGFSQGASQQPTLGRDGSRPSAPPPSGQRQRFFLDWLLD